MLAIISDTGWNVIGTVLLAMVNIIGAIAIAMLQRQGIKLEQVRHATNSLTDRLVASTAEEEHAKGMEAGRLKEIERDKVEKQSKRK